MSDNNSNSDYLEKVPVSNLSNFNTDNTSDFNKDETSKKILDNQNIYFRTEIKTFIIWLIRLTYIFCSLLLIGDIIYLLFNEGKHLYSEWFLISLFGSQLVILPLLLMRIITVHLFPKDKN